MHRRNTILGLAAVAALAVSASGLSAQAGASRYGVWRMQSDQPAPAKNVMTYEAYHGSGMQITVASTNARGEDNEWGYVTMFDGAFHPVEGQENAETAVEVIDERSTRIINKRNGRVTQVIINTLSEDGNTINNEYVRLDDKGAITGVSHAVYQRVQ